MVVLLNVMPFQMIPSILASAALNMFGKAQRLVLLEMQAILCAGDKQYFVCRSDGAKCDSDKREYNRHWYKPRLEQPTCQHCHPSEQQWRRKCRRDCWSCGWRSCSCGPHSGQYLLCKSHSSTLYLAFSAF